MSKDFFMTITKDEDGFFVGDVPSLPGCHAQGRTLEELNQNMKEAIELYDEIEEIEFIGIQKIAVS